MSGMVTRCPHCATTFRITTQQLQTHQGQVRCGRCQNVFDGFAALASLAEPQAAEVVGELTTSPAQEAQPAIQQRDDILHAASEQTATARMPSPSLLLDYAPAPPELNGGKRGWLWASGNILLLAALTAQAAYFFRSEIAAAYPVLRPVLQNYCELLQCTVALPQRPHELSIEGSDLQAAEQPNVIVLSAMVRNRASVAVAFPAIELTLNDEQNRTVARRVFLPSEYLKKEVEERSGMTANGELEMKLRLNIGELKAAGYRLYLFYPQ